MIKIYILVFFLAASFISPLISEKVNISHTEPSNSSSSSGETLTLKLIVPEYVNINITDFSEKIRLLLNKNLTNGTDENGVREQTMETEMNNE
ncbi:hypothetical protein GCK72_019885 [Caenorhabditis remanei]|uniref:Uncharacterized protein n=1 Tax=Caenorhabditis remanei TaxID=31234 RepID=A0A6A5GFZ6_CAERE|nr:hypothetical protein GCK72_019885 [Caenorhabditis remanei]KAF1753329.1 hypothetical protein GCK72_019885 [Caenorhabditis remanei]